MKEIEVESYNVPAEARSKNYRSSLTTVVGGGGAAIVPSAVVSGGAVDAAKVAQNLAADSTDWQTIANNRQKAIDALKDLYISKTTDDTVAGTIKFLKGLQIGDVKIAYDSTNGALALTRISDSTKLASLYATGGLTAYGAGSGTSGGGTSYNRLDKWSDYTTDKATYILSALLGDDLNTRVSKLENSTITSVDWSIITGKPSTYTPSAHTHVWADITDHPTKLSAFTNDAAFITASAIPSKLSQFTNDSGFLTSVGWSDITNRPSTFTPSAHTHSFGSLTSVPTTLAGYGITDANISNGVITLGANSITPLTAHQDISGKSDITHTHTVKINGTTKTIAATGGTAVDLGTYLTSHQSLTDYMTIEQTGIFVDGKIGALDVASVGGVGSYIQSISEADGKISASVATLPTKLSQFADDIHAVIDGATYGTIKIYPSVQITSSTSDDGAITPLGVNRYVSANYLPLHGTADNALKLGDLDFAQPGNSQGVMRSFSPGQYTDINQYFGNGTVVTFDPKPTNGWSANQTILSLGNMAQRNTQLSFIWDWDDIKYRRITDGPTYNAWRTIAFTDSNITGNAATSTVASKLGRNGNSGVPMIFNWSGQTGQPSWLWGGGDGTNMYVYNPSNFNVNSAVKLATARSLWGQSFDGTGNINNTIFLTNVGTGQYDEGIRVLPHNSWSTLFLGGNDISASTGTSANSWCICNNNGNLYINRHGSNAHTGYELCNVSANWGIGTNSPSYMLDVAGTGRFQGDLVIGNTIIHASGSNGGINSIQPADDYIIGDCNIGGTMGLKSLNTASAGIGFYGNDGTSNGTLTALSSTLTWTGTICATGGVTAYTTSDRRLKKNIRPLDSLRVIRTLGGTFEFDYRKDNRHSIGFIAQNVRKSALSDMVCESAGYLRINYLDTRLISLALGASVELDDEVTRLKKRVSELEKEVKRLKAA